MSVQESYAGKQFSEWDAPVVTLSDRNRVLDFFQEGSSDRIEQRPGVAARLGRDRASLRVARVQTHFGLGSRISRSGVNVAAEVRGCLCPGQHVA